MGQKAWNQDLITPCKNCILLDSYSIFGLENSLKYKSPCQCYDIKVKYKF